MVQMSDDPELRPVVTFPRDAVLDEEHLMAALGESEDKIVELNLPHFRMGRSRKFIWGQVIDELEERARKHA